MSEMHLLDVARDRAEIAALRRRIDVDDRRDVVVADHRHRCSTLVIEASAAEHLGRGRRRADHRHVGKFAHRADQVFGRLRDDRIGDAVLRDRRSRPARSAPCRRARRTGCWSRRVRSGRTGRSGERSTSTFSCGERAGCWMRASATPGIAARSARAALAHRRRLACAFLPAIWMSIGAGAPKFRIWLVMSAGRNAKVVPGKWLRQRAAQCVDVALRSACDLP